MQGMPRQLEAVIDGYLCEDPACLDDEGLQELVVGLERQSSRLVAVHARALSEWDARGGWASDRSRSASARLAREAGCSRAHAQAELARARKLRTMPFLKPQVWRWGIAREPSKARSRASAARLRS